MTLLYTFILKNRKYEQRKYCKKVRFKLYYLEDMVTGNLFYRNYSQYFIWASCKYWWKRL